MYNEVTYSYHEKMNEILILWCTILLNSFHLRSCLDSLLNSFNIVIILLKYMYNINWVRSHPLTCYCHNHIRVFADVIKERPLERLHLSLYWDGLLAMDIWFCSDYSCQLSTGNRNIFSCLPLQIYAHSSDLEIVLTYP